MFVIFQVGPVCSTSLSLPFLNTTVHVIFGAGLPDASQNNSRSEPSRTVWSWLTLVILAGAENNNFDKTTRNNVKARRLMSIPFMSMHNRMLIIFSFLQIRNIQILGR